MFMKAPFVRRNWCNRNVSIRSFLFEYFSEIITFLVRLLVKMFVPSWLLHILMVDQPRVQSGSANG